MYKELAPPGLRSDPGRLGNTTARAGRPLWGNELIGEIPEYHRSGGATAGEIAIRGEAIGIPMRHREQFLQEAAVPLVPPTWSTHGSSEQSVDRPRGGS